MHPEIKTLVILSPGFPANEADTTCLPAQQQFVQQARENFPGIKIIVLSFQYPYIRSTYYWKDVQVISFNGHNKGGLQRLLLWHKVRRKLAFIKKQYSGIGLFSFWCTECALVGKYFSRKHRLPHFIWILGQDAKKENKFVRMIRPKEQELVAMSDFLADEFHRNHVLRPQHVIPNGIDPRIYLAQRGERNIDVLGAGSLIPLKQYNIFITLLAEAAKKIPGIKAVICGKGSEEQNLQQQVQSSGAVLNISLAGELPHGEIINMMQRAKIFLHPSSYEGFSTVCLEALYAGAHVISFCRPVKQGIPHWHIVNTKEEMLGKLLELLGNPALDHSPVMPFSMKDTATAVMRLFNG